MLRCLSCLGGKNKVSKKRQTSFFLPLGNFFWCENCSRGRGRKKKNGGKNSSNFNLQCQDHLTRRAIFFSPSKLSVCLSQISSKNLLFDWIIVRATTRKLLKCVLQSKVITIFSICCIGFSVYDTTEKLNFVSFKEAASFWINSLFVQQRRRLTIFLLS